MSRKYHLISKKPTDYSFGAVACKRTSGYNFTHCYHGVEWEEFKGLSVDRKCKKCANSVTAKFRERKDNETKKDGKSHPIFKAEEDIAIQDLLA